MKTLIITLDGVFRADLSESHTRDPAADPQAGDTWVRPDGRERRGREIVERIVALEDLDGHLMGRLSLPEFSARVAGWTFISAAPTGSGEEGS